jgi:hypothetical protein
MMETRPRGRPHKRHAGPRALGGMISRPCAGPVSFGVALYGRVADVYACTIATLKSQGALWESRAMAMM